MKTTMTALPSVDSPDVLLAATRSIAGETKVVAEEPEEYCYKGNYMLKSLVACTYVDATC